MTTTERLLGIWQRHVWSRFCDSGSLIPADRQSESGNPAWMVALRLAGMTPVSYRASSSYRQRVRFLKEAPSAKSLHEFESRQT